MAQLVEHILGKDEVPSSNLGSSSKKADTFWCRLFWLYLQFELRVCEANTSSMRLRVTKKIGAPCGVPIFFGDS